MATYRRFHKPVSELSPINRSRIAGGMNRPQIVEAVQWHEGDPVPDELLPRWVDMLEDGDYIILDAPDYPYVWKQDDFEANTEFIAD